MAGTAKQKLSARQNGALGGRPSNRMVMLRRKARERATRLVATQQEESVRFLIYMRDNPNVAHAERIRCAVELLNRGEMPVKSANFLGIGTNEALDEMFSTPKLVVLGKFSGEKNGSRAELVHGNGDEAPSSEVHDEA